MIYFIYHLEKNHFVNYLIYTMLSVVLKQFDIQRKKMEEM